MAPAAPPSAIIAYRPKSNLLLTSDPWTSSTCSTSLRVQHGCRRARPETSLPFSSPFSRGTTEWIYTERHFPHVGRLTARHPAFVPQPATRSGVLADRRRHADGRNGRDHRSRQP